MKYDSFSLFEKNVPPIVLCCNCSWKVLVNVSIATHPESVFVHSRITGHVEPSDRVVSRTASGDTVLALRGNQYTPEFCLALCCPLSGRWVTCAPVSGVM